MLNQKSLLVSLAVLSMCTLTVTSCGKSKESRTDVRAQQDQQLDQQVEMDDSQTLQPDSVAKNNNTLIPIPKSDSLNGDNTLAPSEDMGDADQTKKSSSKKAAPLFDEAEAVKTGGKLDKLSYTSSATDGLMTEFRSYNNMVNAEQKTMNLNLAKAIVAAKIKRSSGDIAVDLTLDESMDGVKKITTYKLKATEEGDKYSLSKVSSNGDLEFEGGYLKCIDADGGCENAYIKVKLSGAYARVIFRNSYADRFFILLTGSQGSAFELWKSYLMNTVKLDASSQKIDYVQASSFEVVNGRSSMAAMIMTQDKDLVGLNIPLLASDKGTQVSAQVTKISDSNGMHTQKLSSAIKDAKLMNNNGKGDVRLHLDVSSDNQQAGIIMTLSRVQKATLTIAQIKGFESKIPKF